MKQSFLKSE